MSWTIDKVAIIDSFGKTLSVCQKGLILESDHSVYLPLYSGECNIPLDTDNSTVPSILTLERVAAEEKQQPGSIGPFTKEQNYETKDSEYSVESSLSTDRMAQRKSLGPFTKEQNVRVVEVETMPFTEDAEKQRNIANPWTVLDISSDGDSNSLENADSEHGRSFSGAKLIYHTSTAMQRPAETNVTTTTTSTTTTTTEFLPEIKEPVLRPSKKETGRSLKLPEITEPILRPRATRHNSRNEAMPQQYDNDEIQETSSTSTRSFTVQFLPERLANILAQAERYARQTLLPLISHYTPSFMTGMRSHEEPKYFPLLSDITQPKNTDASAEIDKTTDQNNNQLSRKDINQYKSDESFSFVEDGRRHEESKSKTQMENGENVSNEYSVSKAEAPPVIVEAVYPEKVADANFTDPSETRMTEIRRENDDWRPINESTILLKNPPSRRDSNVSRSLNWSIDYNRDWTFLTDANSKAEVKLDNDWIPITFKNDAEVSTTARGTTLSEEAAKETDTTDNSRKSAQDIIFSEVKEETTTANAYARKFIPLLDFEETGNLFSSTNSNDIPETTTSASHIQKIPRHEQAMMNSARMLTKSTMMFPYAYERKNDPRTRYIPLIPEEDMGKLYSSVERDR